MLAGMIATLAASDVSSNAHSTSSFAGYKRIQISLNYRLLQRE